MYEYVLYMVNIFLYKIKIFAKISRISYGKLKWKLSR